jgi:hypothetical protein
MKYIITEAQYSKIQKQAYIDNLLDKINKYGVETLTWNEKRFLEDTDDEVFLDDPIDTVHQIVSILVKNNLVDPDNIISNDEDIEISGLKGVDLPYFHDNRLRIEPSSRSIEHNDGFSIEGDDYEEDIDLEERSEVFRYIEEHWQNIFDNDDWFFFFVNDPEEEDEEF